MDRKRYLTIAADVNEAYLSNYGSMRASHSSVIDYRIYDRKTGEISIIKPGELFNRLNEIEFVVGRRLAYTALYNGMVVMGEKFTVDGFDNKKQRLIKYNGETYECSTESLDYKLNDYISNAEVSGYGTYIEIGCIDRPTFNLKKADSIVRRAYCGLHVEVHSIYSSYVNDELVIANGQFIDTDNYSFISYDKLHDVTDVNDAASFIDKDYDLVTKTKGVYPVRQQVILNEEDGEDDISFCRRCIVCRKKDKYSGRMLDTYIVAVKKAGDFDYSGIETHSIAEIIANVRISRRFYDNDIKTREYEGYYWAMIDSLVSTEFVKVGKGSIANVDTGIIDRLNKINIKHKMVAGTNLYSAEVDGYLRNIDIPETGGIITVPSGCSISLASISSKVKSITCLNMEEGSKFECGASNWWFAGMVYEIRMCDEEAYKTAQTFIQHVETQIISVLNNITLEYVDSIITAARLNIIQGRGHGILINIKGMPCTEILEKHMKCITHHKDIWTVNVQSIRLH